MKRNKEKGSRDFPCSVGNVLAAGVSRAPSARALRRPVFRAPTCASPRNTSLFLGVAFTHSAHGPRHVLGAAFTFHSSFRTSHTQRDLSERFFTRPRSQHVRSAPRPALFWRAASVSPPIGRKTRPLPSASLITVTGRFLHPRLADALPDFFPSPFHRKTFFLFLLFPPP